MGAGDSNRCRGLLAAAGGHLDEARRAFDDALAHHARTGPFERGRTLFARGLLERRAKQKRAAREAIEAGLAIFEELGASIWARGRGPSSAGSAAGPLRATRSRQPNSASPSS